MQWLFSAIVPSHSSDPTEGASFYEFDMNGKVDMNQLYTQH